MKVKRKSLETLNACKFIVRVGKKHPNEASQRRDRPIQQRNLKLKSVIYSSKA
jgi:hypothetical protein